MSLSSIFCHSNLVKCQQITIYIHRISNFHLLSNYLMIYTEHETLKLTCTILPAAVTSSSSTIIWKWHEYQIIFQCRYMYFPLLLWKYLLVLQDTICCWYNLMAWVTTMIQEGIKSPSKNKGGSTIISNTNLLSASKCGRRTLKTTTTNKREIDLGI